MVNGGDAGSTNSSAGRFPDGADSHSNCSDFLTQAVATLPIASPAGTTNLKVTSVAGFRPGQTILIDSGAHGETGVISTVGTAGATTLRAPTSAGAIVLPAADVTGFRRGQEISIDDGAETAVVSAVRGGSEPTITLTVPLARAHASGGQISGSGITLTTPLTKTHSSGAQVSDNVPTPGAPNQYQSANR